jgi:RNA polymerase sigma factor (sigma-70 family)
MTDSRSTIPPGAAGAPDPGDSSAAGRESPAHASDAPATGDPSDEDLVRWFQRNPESEEGRSAAVALFERYWERTYLWCYRRVRNDEMARDLAQEVLVSAYQGLGAFEGRCLYSSWLYTIMRNRCLRALRRPSLVRDDEVEIERLRAPGNPADLDLEEREDEEEILRLIREHLAPEEQDALWMRVAERLPVEEITRRLAISSASGARGVLQSGRRKLRAALERHRGKGPL